MRSLLRRMSRPIYWILSSLLVLAFLCGGFTLTYLVFPPAAINILILGLDHGSSAGRQIQVDTALLVRVDPAQFTLRSLVIPLQSTVLVWDETTHPLSELALIPDAVPAVSAVSIDNVGIPIRRVVILDYDVFEQLIDDTGGVRIYVERIIEDTDYPDLETADNRVKTVRFESGWQVLSGERALEYSRMVVDGELSRSIRQQQILDGWVNQVKSPQNWLPVTSILLQNARTNLSLQDVLFAAPVVVSSQGRIFSDTFCDKVCMQNWILPNHP